MQIFFVGRRSRIVGEKTISDFLWKRLSCMTKNKNLRFSRALSWTDVIAEFIWNYHGASAI